MPGAMNQILTQSITKDIVTRASHVLNNEGVNSCNGPQNDTISNDHDASIHKAKKIGSM